MARNFDSTQFEISLILKTINTLLEHLNDMNRTMCGRINELDTTFIESMDALRLEIWKLHRQTNNVLHRSRELKTAMMLLNTDINTFRRTREQLNFD